MRRIRFGFSIPADALDKGRRATYVDDLNRALELVSGHFDAAWVIDHLQFGDADVLEGFTTLTYMAALHPRLKFGHTVLCQSFRNPALLAKMGATLQFLSGGRYILGMGAGWNKEEYTAYGYDFPPGGVRVEQLEEALQIVKALWTEEQATFEGKHYRVIEAHCEPRPIPVPPVLIGAFRSKMLRLTAKYADLWDVSRPAWRNTARLPRSSSEPAPMSGAIRRRCDGRGAVGAHARRRRNKPRCSRETASASTAGTSASWALRGSWWSRCAPSSSWASTISSSTAPVFPS